jgi:hypothetical protein
VGLRRRQVGLGDDVEQPHLQGVAGRIERPRAGACQLQVLPSAVVLLGDPLDEAGVAQAGH